jgi:hypothetical protein
VGKSMFGTKLPGAKAKMETLSLEKVIGSPG